MIIPDPCCETAEIVQAVAHLLCGRPVIALTDSTARIGGKAGTVTVYRRHNKPALGTKVGKR